MSAARYLTVTTDLIGCTVQEPMVTHKNTQARAKWPNAARAQIMHLGLRCLISPCQAMSKIRHSQTSALKISSLLRSNNLPRITLTNNFQCFSAVTACA